MKAKSAWAEDEQYESQYDSQYNSEQWNSEKPKWTSTDFDEEEETDNSDEWHNGSGFESSPTHVQLVPFKLVGGDRTYFSERISRSVYDGRVQLWDINPAYNFVLVDLGSSDVVNTTP